MGTRKALLATAAAVAALAGGGAAAYFASTADDEQARSITLGQTEPDPSLPSEDPPAPPTPVAPAEADPEPAPEAAEPTSAGTRKTRFPRERRKPRNDPPRRVFSVPPAREFSGTGNATLGTVNVRKTAVVRWSTTGHIELRFGREAFPITAPSATGQLIVPPYDFEQVRVIARGRWKISITPQR